MSRRVIAFSGWRGSGKDSAADFLVQEYGFTKLSFARILKDMVAQQYGIPRSYLDDPAQKEAPLTQYPVIPTDSFSSSMQKALSEELKSGYWTPRALCILEGTAKRAVHANYWIRRVSEMVLGVPDTDFVISDLRYKSEADTLKLLIPDIQLIRVQRFDSIDTQDPSERDLDDYKFDYRISNRGTKDDLYHTLSSLPIISFDDLDDK